MTALLLLIACDPAPAVTDSAEPSTTPSTTPSTSTPPTETSTSSPPVDRDGDGYTEDLDCDDSDEDINPGIEERWNGWDDDCDGWIDADGHYTGSSTFTATAVKEGDYYNFSLSCPTTLTREKGTFSLLVSCSPDPSDDWAMLLLGKTVLIDAASEIGTGTKWSGRCTLSSSNDWDTYCDATLDWPDLTSVQLSSERAAASLSYTSSGSLTRTTDPP